MEISEKFTRLDGYPLGQSLSKSFFQSAALKVGMLGTVASVSAFASKYNLHDANEFILLSLTMPLITAVSVKILENFRIRQTFREASDDAGPKNKFAIKFVAENADLDRHACEAKKMKRYANRTTVLFGAFAAAIYLPALPGSESISEVVMVTGLACQSLGPVVATLQQCASRFDRVVNGKSAIVPLPPPTPPAPPSPSPQAA